MPLPLPCRMSTFNNIETANLIWVFAKWGVTPTAPWLAAYSNQLQAQLLALQPPELCSVLWAAAMMQLALPNPVLDALLLEAQVSGLCVASVPPGGGRGGLRCSHGAAAAARPCSRRTSVRSTGGWWVCLLLCPRGGGLQAQLLAATTGAMSGIAKAES
jgi:hypothetical protein